MAFCEVADLLDALMHDGQELAAESRAQEIAQANVKLAQESIIEGNIGTLAVLDAQRQSSQTRLRYVRTQARRNQDMVQLILALGGAAPSAAAPVHAP
jgi:outer membrane protein TolC